MTATDNHWRRREGVVLLWLFVGGVLLRGFVGASLLDRLYGYSSGGGSLLTRLSPGAYLLFATAAFAATRPVDEAARVLVRPALLLGAVAGLGAAWAIVTGSVASIGALFDLYLVAAAALFILSRLPERQRRIAFQIVLVVLAVNGLVLAAEFVLRHRLVTQAFLEFGPAFRPAAALDHPLISGLVYAVAAPVVVRLRVPLALKLLLAGLAVAAVAMSGARVATLTAVGLYPLVAIAAFRAEPNHPGERRWLCAALFASLLPALVAAALALGLGHRFAGGLVDDSALKRVRDFQMLAYLTPHQWRFGGVGGALQDWSLRLFDGASVESPVVSAVFIFGAPVAALLFALLIVALIDLARISDWPGRLALLSFLVIACSNNTLVVKSPSLVFAVVLAGAVIPARARMRDRSAVPVRALRPPARSRPSPASAASAP